MGEDLFTCNCGEATSDYQAVQCQECSEFYCSSECRAIYCCGNKISKKTKSQINKYENKIKELKRKILELRQFEMEN